MIAKGGLVVVALVISTLLYGCAAGVEPTSKIELGNAMYEQEINAFLEILQDKTQESHCRDVASGQLGELVTKSSPGQRLLITTRQIELITRLVDDEQESVSANAVLILGRIGPRAIGAIPRIRVALVRIAAKERKMVVGPSVPAQLLYYWAIEQIDGEPIPDWVQEGKVAPPTEPKNE